MKNEADKLGVKLVETAGKQYINLGQNSDLAIEFTLSLLNEKDANSDVSFI